MRAQTLSADSKVCQNKVVFREVQHDLQICNEIGSHRENKNMPKKYKLVFQYFGEELDLQIPFKLHQNCKFLLIPSKYFK